MFLNKVFKTTLKKFPGTLPVSLNRKHLFELFGIHPDMYLEFTLSFKADGERFFIVFLCVSGEYLCVRINREFLN